MKSGKKTFSFDILLLWIAITTVVILRSIAVSRNLNFEFGYFEDNALISVAGWLSFGWCILFLGCALLTKRTVSLIPTYNTPATYIPSALTATALLFLSKNLASRFIEFAGHGRLDLSAALALLCAMCAVASAVGLFFYVMIGDRKSPARSYFLMLISVSFILYAIYLYFDTTLPINAPNKITDQLAYVAASIFFLFEAKISMGQNNWRWYSAVGYTAAILCAYSSVPGISAFFINNEIVSNSIYETILTFTLFLFITARLILVDEYVSDTESSIAGFIRKSTAKLDNTAATLEQEAIHTPDASEHDSESEEEKASSTAEEDEE